MEEVNGIRCTNSVKYLGVRVAVDKKDQIRISKEQVNKNVQLLRWRLKRVDSDVLERLTCCLARSMLIYMGLGLCESPYRRCTTSELTDKRTRTRVDTARSKMLWPMGMKIYMSPLMFVRYCLTFLRTPEGPIS